MQPYPRSPDLVSPGHLHGSGCLSARAVGTGFPTVGLRLWLGPGCGWVWVLLTPASRGWGLGWVCLGSVSGVVPLLPAVCGVRGWALVSACFWVVCGLVLVSLAPRRFRFRCAVWACVLGPGLGCAQPFLAGLSGCVVCAFFFPVAGCPCPGPCDLSPHPLFFGLGCWLFFFFLVCLLVSVPLFPVGRCSWLGVAGFGWVVPLCLFGGPVFGALWVGGLAAFCVLGGRFGGCGLFSRGPPLPVRFFLGGGWGGRPGCSSSCFPSAGARSVAGVWCGWSLATPGGGSCVLLPATPGWLSLPVFMGGPRHSWLGSAGGVGVWCVVCGLWRWCVGGVVAGVWCGWSLATPGGGSCVLLPATSGWVSLPVVVGGPRHSWLGSAGGGGVWCVVCGGGVLVGLWLVCGVVGPSPLLAEVPVCYSPPLLAGFRCRWWWAVPATPGWGPLAALVCSVWCVVSGGGVLVGLWLVCGVVGPLPLRAAVPVCYSPPLLAGFRCRWWWAVPATPGWGPLAAVVCGVWCVAVVCWLGCGWCVVWLVPRHSWRRSLCATPSHSWLGFAAGGGGRFPLLLAGVRWRRWCVVCGVWCVAVVCWWGCGGCVVWLVPRHSWRRFLCATPRHSWLGFAAGGGGRSPPLLAGVRWRRWCVVCGVLVGSLATPGGGSCVLLPATPGWVSLPVVVGGPRHSWLGSAGGGGVWCVVCGVGCLAVVCWWGCGWARTRPSGRPLVCVCVRVRALLGRVGRASLPGAFWCGSPFPLAALSFCFAWPPPGWGCPPLSRCRCRSSLPWRCVLVVFLGLPLPGSPCARALSVSPAWSLAALLWLLPHPRPLLCLVPFCVSRFSSLLLAALVFFFSSPSSSSTVRPCCLRLSLVSGPGCPGPRRLRCLLCWPSTFRLSVRLSLFRAFRLAVGCSLVVAAPPPPLCLAVFVAAARCCVPCCAVRPWVRCCRAVSPGVVLSCAVLCSFGAAACCAVPSGVVRRPGALCSAVLCFAVFPRAVCSVLCVFCRGAVVRAVVRRSALCCVCPGRGAVLCVSCALRSVRCCASLCWCARVVLFVWCVLLLAPGAVVRCCVLCCFLWCAVVRCWVWWPVVVCWWRVSVSVSLSGRVVCFPVVGVVCCGALLSCVVFCGAVLPRGAVLLCSAVVLRCCWGLLCPPVGCRAVLCCAVGWLCCFLPGGGARVLWCSFPHAVRSLSSPLCALRCLVVLAVVPCFPVSCAVALCCRVVLCCRALLSFCGAVCVCFALLRPVVRRQCGLRCCWCLMLWRVPVHCGVSLGVLRCGGAALVCRGVLLCCALSCGVLPPVPCPAVPCCPAVLCWLAVLCGCLRCWCLFFLLSSFPLLKTPAVFPCLAWAGNNAGVTGDAQVIGGAAPILLRFVVACRHWAWSVRHSRALVWVRSPVATPAGVGSVGRGGARRVDPAASPPRRRSPFWGRGGIPSASGVVEGWRPRGPQVGGGWLVGWLLPLCPGARPGPPRLEATGGRGCVTRCASHVPRALGPTRAAPACSRSVPPPVSGTPRSTASRAAPCATVPCFCGCAPASVLCPPPCLWCVRRASRGFLPASAGQGVSCRCASGAG